MPRAARSLVFLCLATLLLAPAWPAQRANHLYPEWFVRPPRITGVVLAVGYAPSYGDTALSVREARDDGLGALRIHDGVRLRSEYLQEVLTTGSVAYRGESYAEDTLGQSQAAVVADSALLFRMVLVLVSSDSLSVRGRRVAFASRPPAWIETTPPNDDGVYAVGSAAAHFNEYDAWKEAERQARRSLAFGVATALRSTLESTTGGTARGALIASTAAELHDVDVRERWRDERRLFVLVHAHVAPASQ